MPRRPWQVILLPGSVMPAGPAHGALLAELGPDVDARAKELEVYAADAPPPGWSLATEVDGITRVADEAGFGRFHLVGYSGGGAACLEFAARHPERLLSLAIRLGPDTSWVGVLHPTSRSAARVACDARLADVVGHQAGGSRTGRPAETTDLVAWPPSPSKTTS